MSEPRFTCPQCPPCEACEGSRVVECWSPGGPCPSPNDPTCETCGECRQCQFTLPGVLAHWRWHTEQADSVENGVAALLPFIPEFQKARRHGHRNRLPQEHRIGLARQEVEAVLAAVSILDPAFTLTLIDQLGTLLNIGSIGHMTRKVREAVVAVVVAAGYEVVE